MDYTIYPYEGIGPLRFGMTPEQVREILGEPSKSFNKSHPTTMLLDSFHELNCQVSYKQPGLCNAIQLMKSSNLTFGELNFFGSTFSLLRNWFRQNDSLAEEDNDSLTSHKFGIGLYVPDYCGRNEKAMVEAVIVFEKGYYDKSKK